jgi:hypothetical protein
MPASGWRCRGTRPCEAFGRRSRSLSHSRSLRRGSTHRRRPRGLRNHRRKQNTAEIQLRGRMQCNRRGRRNHIRRITAIKR